MAIPYYAIETVSGRYVDISDPRPEAIHLPDIVWALSRQSRFAGHTISHEIWSIAQHAIFVERLLQLALSEEHGLHYSLQSWLYDKDLFCTQTNNKNMLLGALHHDDSEAYLVDLPSPIKRMPEFKIPYKNLEDKVMAAINSALNLKQLSPYEAEHIVWADLMALHIEAKKLKRSGGDNWGMKFPLIQDEHIQLFPQVMPWRDVFNQFFARHKELIKNNVSNEGAN